MTTTQTPGGTPQDHTLTLPGVLTIPAVMFASAHDDLAAEAEVEAEVAEDEPHPGGCTCDAYGDAHPEMHAEGCPGEARVSWRARMPGFLMPEIDAIWDRHPTELPAYRRSVLNRACIARHGRTVEQVEDDDHEPVDAT